MTVAIKKKNNYYFLKKIWKLEINVLYLYQEIRNKLKYKKNESNRNF